MKIKPVDVAVSGLGAGRLMTTHGVVTGELYSHDKHAVGTHVEFTVMPLITSRLLNQALCTAVAHDHLKPEMLADAEFHVPGPIDALIGAGTLAEIMTNEITFLNQDSVAMRTSLGHVIFGNSREIAYPAAIVGCAISNDQLNEAIQKLWRTQEYPKTAEWSPS